MKLVSQSLVRRVVGPSAGSSWLYYYMPVTTTIKTVNAVPSSGVVVTLEIFFGLGLTVTEINSKKVQKQDLKIIKNVKRLGMACQKVCKQGRDNAGKQRSTYWQSPIPTSFSHYS